MNGAQKFAIFEQYGTNAERLALDTTQIRPLTMFYETDTTNTYQWFGTWVIVPAAGGGGGAVTIADGADVTMGAKADAAATTDTGTFSLIALVKRLLGKLPGLGQAAAANSMSVVLSSDGPFATNFGLQADAAATTDTGSFSLIAFFKRGLQNWTTLLGLSQSTTSGVSVNLRTLLSGEDQSNGWQAFVNGAFQSYRIFPLGTAAGTMPVSDSVLGTTGAVGDYLDKLVVSVSSNTNGAVYIREGIAADIAGGTAGTNPAGTTTLAVTASAAQTWLANQYANYIVRVTYTPTSGVSTTIKRKIASHAAVAASTAISLTLSHAIPAGATITAWGLEPITSSWEVVPYNAPVGTATISLQKKSTLGAFKLSVDLGVQVEACGKFV